MKDMLGSCKAKAKILIWRRCLKHPQHLYFGQKQTGLTFKTDERVEVIITKGLQSWGSFIHMAEVISFCYMLETSEDAAAVAVLPQLIHILLAQNKEHQRVLQC